MPKRQHEEQLAKKGSPVTVAQIEAMAKKAIERRVPGTGGEVTLPLRITLTRAHWEALSAAAIRKGVNLETVNPPPVISSGCIRSAGERAPTWP